MPAISLEPLTDDQIECCRELCDELMAVQRARARIHPECFAGMNFDTRMARSHAAALRKQVLAVSDKGVPVGYVFSTIQEADEADRQGRPAWAPPGEHALGFYPDWLRLPQRVGCLSNLYVREAYRGLGLGGKLLRAATDWLESFADTNVTFVYVSNGNEAALQLYFKHGFVFSHDVFGGFIKAAYKLKG